MSAVEKYRALLSEAEALKESAKKEALDIISAGINALNELGFTYHLTEASTKAVPRSSGTRRTGIREEVLAVVKKAPSGIASASIQSAMGASDKQAKQAVANALSALKREGKITQDGKLYKAA